MKIPYRTKDVETPAPVLKVRLIHPDTKAKATVMARVDSGVDITTIPFALLEELNLVAVGRTFTAGYDDPGTSRLLFTCSFRFRSFSFEKVRVISALTPEVLIGLDLLNQMHVCLNGHEKQLEIEEKRARPPVLSRKR